MKVILLATWTIAIVLMPAGGDRRVGAAGVARSAPAAHTCHNTQLTIHTYTSQGAAGHIGLIYRIHNLSGRACTLIGYPGVQLLDGHFLSLPTTVRRTPGNLVGPIPSRLIHIGARGNAYFALGFSDVPVNNQPCRTAYYLMIFAPNDFLPVVTRASGSGGMTACTGNINVSPVTAHPRFQ
ncbi:MAG: hypothetical protein NVS2B16_27570 [Chloroflexota bacterium]